MHTQVEKSEGEKGGSGKWAYWQVQQSMKNVGFLQTQFGSIFAIFVMSHVHGGSGDKTRTTPIEIMHIGSMRRVWKVSD